MARLNRNTFRGRPTRSPRSDTTPTANAISVAIGIPQPEAGSPDGLKAKKMSAGKTIPPIAAIAGRAAAFGSFRWPETSSLFISRPTTKKKITISASFTSFDRVR